jgi:tetratricopeptide (TPR) repeat protein
MLLGYGLKKILFSYYFFIFLSLSNLISQAGSSDCLLRIGCLDQEIFFDEQDKPSIDNFDLLIEGLFSDSAGLAGESIVCSAESLLRSADLYLKKQWYFWAAVFFYKAAESFKQEQLFSEATICYLRSANLFSKIIKYYLHSVDYYKAACCCFYAASGYDKVDLLFYAKKLYNQAEGLFKRVKEKEKSLKIRKLSSSLSSAELDECLSNFKDEESLEKLKLIAQACFLNNDFKEAEIIYSKIVRILSEVYQDEKFLPDDFKLGNQVVDFFLSMAEEAKYNQDYFMVQKYYSTITFCYLKMNKERKIAELYSAIIKHCKGLSLLSEALFFEACFKKIGISEKEIRLRYDPENLPISIEDKEVDSVLFAEELMVEAELLSKSDLFFSGLNYYFAGNVFLGINNDRAKEAFVLSVNTFNKFVLSNINDGQFKLVSEIYLFLFNIFKKIKFAENIVE